MNYISNMFGSSSKDGRGLTSVNVNCSGAEAGGASRDDGRGAFGYSLLKGKRSTMEDYLYAQYARDPKNGEQVGLFGVFDGHGGSSAADYVKANLFKNLLQNSKFSSDLNSAIVDSYVQTDKNYLGQQVNSNRDDGCTAVTAVVVGNKLFVANVGDSRAVLCRSGKGIALSIDHKPNRADERTRIENAGGVVVWAGTWRVCGVLAVSRAFGDRPLKRYVVAEPDVRVEDITHDDEFLILASDGVWDVLANQDAVDMIRNTHNPEAAAKKLTEEAYIRGSNDNISCVVVRFRS